MMPRIKKEKTITDKIHKRLNELVNSNEYLFWPTGS